MLGGHIALLYSVLDGSACSNETHDEVQIRETVTAVTAALRRAGHRVSPVRARPGFWETLDTLSPDLVFNLATGVHRKEEQAHVAGILEMAGYPFTGSGLTAHVLGLEKGMAKKVFTWAGVPTPRFQVLAPGSSTYDPMLRFPLIVKPVREGSGLGIHEDAVVGDAAALERVVRRIWRRFRQPALVEEYIAGRELTVGILGNDPVQVLPIMEILFDPALSTQRRILTYEVKVADAIDRRCPARLEPPVAARVAAVARQAFAALGCCDLARLDIRLSPDGVPYVLELNTLPGLQPGYSEYPRLAATAGIEFDELIARLVDIAIERWHNQHGNGGKFAAGEEDG
jgi:D-alanine-D-alanine ligase